MCSCMRARSWAGAWSAFARLTRHHRALREALPPPPPRPRRCRHTPRAPRWLSRQTVTVAAANKAATQTTCCPPFCRPMAPHGPRLRRHCLTSLVSLQTCLTSLVSLQTCLAPASRDACRMVIVCVCACTCVVRGQHASQPRRACLPTQASALAAQTRPFLQSHSRVAPAAHAAILSCGRVCLHVQAMPTCACPSQAVASRRGGRPSTLSTRPAARAAWCPARRACART